MSESAADTQTKPAAAKSESPDKHAFAQVEKWMAMIREINRERPEPTKLPG